MTIWLASGNAHKKAEIAAIFNCEVKIPADIGLAFDPEENGDSFYENALIKAKELYRLLSKRGLLDQRNPQLFEGDGAVLADDSGLCVDTLDGRPGIFSARYGSVNGKKLTDNERNTLLLKELAAQQADGVSNRSARFVCAMALLINDSRFYLAQETFEGEIVSGQETAKGSGGFGYDPILYIPSLGRTVAELSEDEKNRISHRGKAGRVIAAVLHAITNA